MYKKSIKIKPISVNACWQGRRFKTNEYKSYEQEMLYRLGSGSVAGFVVLSLIFKLKNFANRDVDNMIKPIQDILVKKGIIEDDRKIVELHAKKEKSNKDEVIINIEKIKESEVILCG